MDSHLFHTANAMVIAIDYHNTFSIHGGTPPRNSYHKVFEFPHPYSFRGRIFYNLMAKLWQMNLQAGRMEATITNPIYQITSHVAKENEPTLIELVEKGINTSIGKSEGLVHEMCASIASSGGKRIRPQLVLQSGVAFSAANAKMVDAAVAAELIHMASLVHDDVIDQSGLRRGMPSVNRQWGNHAAVLCGDWLFAQAFALLSGKGLAGCMHVMVDAIQSMCQGELIQAANQYNLNVGFDTYIEAISMKTAKLLESCCKAGALSGNADASGVQALGEFGLNIGIAFQIIDDILDFQGCSAKTGKPKDEDLRQGIITLPIIVLLKDAKYGGQARELLSCGDFSDELLATINEMLYASDSIEVARQIASSYIDKAQRCLEALPKSESVTILHNMASLLRQREK